MTNVANFVTQFILIVSIVAAFSSLIVFIIVGLKIKGIHAPYRLKITLWTSTFLTGLYAFSYLGIWVLPEQAFFISQNIIRPT